MKPVTFNLQIFLPGRAEDPPLSIDASTPFMPFQRGDIFSPRYGDHFSHVDEVKGKLLRVVTVEHGLQEFDENIRHYVRVYTEAVPDDVRALIPA